MEEGECSHVGWIEPNQFVMGIVQAVGIPGGCLGGGEAEADCVQSPVKENCQERGWNKRIRIGRAPPDRTPCLSRPSALENSIRGFADKVDDEVIDRQLGTMFDSLGEAYDFYNLYSWEHGFGIRYEKSRLNAQKTKCMQKFVCGCSGKPSSENTKSCRCECPAMIRLLRTEDNGWYITEDKVNYNPAMIENCGEKTF